MEKNTNQVASPPRSTPNNSKQKTTTDNNFIQRNKDLNNFITFLRERKPIYIANQHNKYVVTHTAMGDPIKGAFTIPDKDIPTFNQLYENLLKHRIPMSIIEQHREHVAPLLIDLDFRQNVPERLYTKELIIEFVKKLDAIVNQYIAEEEPINFLI